jgi:integrase
MLRWIVCIALETGTHSSEIVTLRRMQVDIERRIVRPLETKNTLSSHCAIKYSRNRTLP